jgi:hypothetical protein
MRDDVTRPGYEVSDVKPRGIVMFLIGLAVLTVILTVLLRVVFSMLEARAVRHDRVEPVPVEREAALRGDRQTVERPSDPQLQSNPLEALAAVRASETRILGTYGWVSREAGVARIPIDRAIDLVLERGLPVRAGAERGDSEMRDSSAHEMGAALHDDAHATAVVPNVIPRDSNSGRASGTAR